jgi:hypothetical protein
MLLARGDAFEEAAQVHVRAVRKYILLQRGVNRALLYYLTFEFGSGWLVGIKRQCIRAPGQ